MPLPIDLECVSDISIANKAAIHQLTVTDQDQFAFLRSVENLDLQASPGCGKTTLTGLKLSLLASGWKSDVQGVCVLSHTNVAKDQIIDILKADKDGCRFLQYPHYIGTIQGFVDSFLAFPYMRSNDFDLRSVDDGFFAAAAKGEVRKDAYKQLRNLSNPPNPRSDIEPLVQTAHYVSENGILAVHGMVNGSRSAFPFGPNAASTQQFLALKKAVSERGIFTFADMYAFAQQYLNDQPQLRGALRRRFPFLLIDEMQDTSEQQESFLSGIFEQDSVVQRIGDVNQRIYSEFIEAGQDNLQFPKAGHGGLSKSMRFSNAIASAASHLTISSPQSLEGNEVRTDHPPRLILFEQASIALVLPRFAKEVLDNVPAEELANYPVKAIGARKSGTANEFPRQIRCYWPEYNSETVRIARPLSLKQAVLTVQARSEESWKTLSDILWDACCELLIRWECAFNGKRPTQRKLKSILAEGDSNIGLATRKAILGLVTVDTQSEQDWNSKVNTLIEALRSALQLDAAPAAVGKYVAFGTAPVAADYEPQRCDRAEITLDEHALTVELATIHAVKGETHAATLVLECFHHVYDLKEVLPIIVQKHDPQRLANTQSIKPAARRTFVGMTRPRSLLAFAVRKGHIETLTEDFVAAGWIVIDLTIT